MDQQDPPDDELIRQWKFFQGMDGIPFRTQGSGAPDYKTDDSLSKKPKLVTDIKVEYFDLSKTTEREEMSKILDLCAKGKGYVSSMDRQFDNKISNWKVLLIWGRFFLEDPRETNIAGSVPNADRQVF